MYNACPASLTPAHTLYPCRLLVGEQKLVVAASLARRLAFVLYPCRLLVGELRVKSYDWCSPAAATGKPETIQVWGTLGVGWLQGKG